MIERKPVCKLDDKSFSYYANLLQLQSKVTTQVGLLYTSLQELVDEGRRIKRKVEAEWSRIRADNGLEMSKNYQLDISTKEICEVINTEEVGTEVVEPPKEG